MNDTRKSKYPMIDMENALDIIYNTSPGYNCGISEYDLKNINNHINTEDIYAKENFPRFKTSVMDGYAVKAPCSTGIYKIKSKVYAGDTVSNSYEDDFFQMYYKVYKI